MLRTMSASARRVLLIAIVAVAAAVVVLLLARPPVAAPTASASASAHPTSSGRDEPAPAAAWVRAQWEAIRDPFAPHDRPLLRVDGLVDGGDLYVAWGRVPMQGRNQFNDLAAVFTSPDGRDWTVTPIVHGVNGPSTSELVGVAVGPHGYLAFGGVCCEPESRAVWSSADGISWTRLEMGGELNPAQAYLVDAVAIEGGWVAAGIPMNGNGADIWRSSDGDAWESVLHVEGGLAGLAISDLAATPTGVIAVGTLSGPDGTYDGAVWESSDGATWERLAADDPALVGEGEVRLESVTPFAGGLFVTGAFGSSEERRQCEQLGQVATSDALPPMTALSCGWGTSHHWISEGGISWERVDPAAAGREYPIETRLASAGGPGLVVLGESSKPASPDTTLFTSPDGTTWIAVPPALPVGSAVGVGLAVRGNEVVAITEDFDGQRSDVAAWVVRVD